MRALRAQYDERWGGFGRAPKFPPASAIEFLLRAGELDLVRGTLDGMAAGGMYDLVGGGFHRYSVDEQWLVPHFEKMLYDNALLIPAYLHGWLVTGEDRYRRVVEQTVEYVLRELRLEGGGFASAQDADTDGVEGLTFTWTPDEIERTELLLPFEHGQYILRGELSDDERARLLATREQRPQPARDDKAIAAWNGLMLAALAEAGRRLERDDWLDAARELAEFLLGPLSDGERLHRTWRDGVAKGTGYLEDYANVAHGLYELHVATGDVALAARVAPARAPRHRSLRRRRERRLLPHARRRRGARRAAEGPRRQSDAVRQLDARVPPAPARAPLGRRRARATCRRRAATRPRRDPARAAGLRLGALRARPLPLAAA